MYRQIELPASRVISMKSDLMAHGRYQRGGRSVAKKDILADHVAAIDEVFDLAKTTLVVATSTTNLCETDTPYDPENTRSIVGAFNEYVRKLDGTLRSFHAFESYTAIGPRSAEICANVSPVSYGVDSPESRLVDLGAICIVLGVNPIRCCSTIHYLEQAVGVPYRYIRTYEHPVSIDGETKLHTFYRNPWYRDSDIRKNTDRFFEHLYAQGFSFHRLPLGMGEVNVYSISEVYTKGVNALKDDPFLCLEFTPTIQPWNH